MAKLTVPINSAGGNAGPVKNRVYERKKVQDANLGVDKSKTYLLKPSGINQYDFTNVYSIVTGNSGNLNVSYVSNFNMNGNNVSGLGYYNYDPTQNETFRAFYVMAEDKWYTLDANNENYILLEDFSKLVIFNIQQIGYPETLVNIILNADGSEFNPKTYKIENITVEEKVEDLKNWYYDDAGELGLLNVPDWEILEENYDTTVPVNEIYRDMTNLIEIKVTKITGQNNQYLGMLLEVHIKNEQYNISSLNNEWYKLDLSQPMTISVGLAPNIGEIDENCIMDETLFDAVYGPQILWLKHKFKKIENDIESKVDNTYLKYKTYDLVEEELTDGNEYSFKEDLSDFFTKGYTAQTIYDIYQEGGETPVLLSPKSRDAMSIEPASEVITYIEYAFGFNKAIGELYIHIITNMAEYYFYPSAKTWTKFTDLVIKGVSDDTNLPPNLIYNSEYVVNEEMLKALLNVTKEQTLEEKFNEGIKNWFYDKPSTSYQFLYDLSKVTEFAYQDLLAGYNLLPVSNNDNIIADLYLDTMNGLKITYNASGSNGGTYTITYMKLLQASYKWKYTCVITSGNNSTCTWTYTENNVDTPITSQNDMPTIDFNPEYMLSNYDAQLITELLTTKQNGMTLEEKVNDLPNWEYSDISQLRPRDTIDWEEVGNLNGWEDDQIIVYGDVETGSVMPMIAIEASLEGFMVRIYDNVDIQTATGIFYLMSSTVINNVVQANKWYRVGMMQGQEGIPVQVSVDDIPDYVFNNLYMLNQDAFDLIFQSKSGTLRQKFQTCLTLERLTNITIPSTSINTENTNDYANSGFIWKVTLQDDAFKDALKVDVLFDLSQIISENVCPIQDVDAENGTLTLYVKQNSGNILVNRIDIFKNCK